MKEIGIYIHIPFCIKKCEYCDFVSYCNKKEYVPQYINALKKEIKNNINKEYKITTIYIGGGTPSSIEENYIADIIETIKLNMNDEDLKDFENIEVTIEVNPGTVNKEKLQVYKKIGINRLSIGLQETHNELLKSIGRIHTYEEFIKTYKLARKIGFNNINVDLMIALPNQTIQDIKENLENITKLNPEHISVYSLILEEGTPFYNKYNENKIKLPDEELERNMYWYVKNTLENNGYMHYEISNFSKKGFESKHNMNCWNQEEYLGFGVAAHSYNNRIRYSNTNSIEEYIKGSNKIIHEEQTLEDMQKEYMLLGLRKIEGINIQKFKNKFAQNPIFIFKEQLNKLVDEELIIVDGNEIKLTNKGLDLANIVWEEFV